MTDESVFTALAQDATITGGALRGKIANTPDMDFPPAREQIMLHDHSGTGFPTWEVLSNGGSAAGVVSFDGRGLRLTSPDVSTGTPGGQSSGASALARLARPSGVGVGGFSRMYLQFDWRFRVYRSNAGVYTYTKGPEFGLDTADWGTASNGGDGIGSLAPTPANRTLCMVRSAIYDESAATYYGGKFQINVGSAGAPSWRDLKDSTGQLVSPTTPGYEQLAVGMNYAKWLRQRTELVIDLTPQTITIAPIILSVTSGSAAATYTTGTPILGAPVRGTSLAHGTFVASFSGLNVVLSQAATATSATQAGASIQSPTVVARLEGLRHNGVGFGSLAIGPQGYSRDLTANPRANELLAQQAAADGAGVVAPALSQDAAFQGGANPYVQVDNRSNQNSKATLLVERARIGVFA